MEEIKPKKDHRKMVMQILVALILVATIGGSIYLWVSSKRIYIDKAEINAPKIDLSSKTGGSLEEVLVKEGDQVKENQLVAQVGNEFIKADTDGLIIKVNNNLGKNFAPGEPVVSMIVPSALRVVGHIEENKGLKDLKIGQHAIFEADAFGSQQFNGVVDDISETSRDSDVVFNISNNRQVKIFDVKVRFNLADYPELKNGMSAKLYIYK